MNLRFPRGRGRDRHPVNVRHFGVDRTPGERLADGVTATIGSWPFIAVQSTILGAWIVVNALVIKDWIGGRPFDPYPFILLNLVLSFQAAYTGPIVMMSQNRQAAKDRDEAEHDYEVNRRALQWLEEVGARLAAIESRLERLNPPAGPPAP